VTMRCGSGVWCVFEKGSARFTVQYVLYINRVVIFDLGDLSREMGIFVLRFVGARIRTGVKVCNLQGFGWALLIN